MPISVSSLDSPRAAPKKPGISVDELTGPVEPAGPSAGSQALGVAKEAWSDYTELSNQYLESLKEDVTAYPKGTGDQVIQSGKTLMDALAAAWSPAESAARTTVIKPVQAAIEKMGDLVSAHAAEDEDWTPQERRMAHLEGKTLPRKYGKGIDWKVHKRDVADTVKSLNEMVESGVLTALGFVGGKKAAEKPGVIRPKGLSPSEMERISKPRMRVVGETPEGKPRVRMLTPAEASAKVRDTVREASLELVKPPAPPGGEDPVLLMENNKPVTRSMLSGAARAGTAALDNLPGVRLAKAKLADYTNQLVRTFSVESLGANAEVAASTIMRNTWMQMHRASARWYTSGVRRAFWNSRMGDAPRFLEMFEKGVKFDDPLLSELAEGYRTRLQQVYESDQRMGLKYDETEHYLPHLFKRSAGVVDYLARKYGTKWGDPSFMKERTGALYQELVAAGHEPRFQNPEDILAAREHASDVAHTQIGILSDLEKFGAAVRVKKGGPPSGFSENVWRAPNSVLYYLHPHAEAVMHNAFRTTSLWQMQNIGGDVFRGMMHLKNAIMPIRLLSLFHLFHEALGLDNATALLRGLKGMLAGDSSPGKALAEVARGTIPFKGSFWDNPRAGHPLLRAYRGQIPYEELTESQKHGLWLMHEGGFSPDMPREYKTNAIRNFHDALQRHSLTAGFHLPGAILQGTMVPMFDHWIPSLKIAAYIKGAAQAIKLNPQLLENPLDRQIALNRIRKGIDERYGEMSYNAMFWPRWVKDLGVLNTLSLAWQMGVLKQFGGAPVDLFRAMASRGSVAEKARAGALDKPLFAASYIALATSYTGLFSWAMSGQFPQGMDWFWPRVGGNGPDGKPNRVGTMFFTKEAASLASHVKNEGLASGLTDLVTNKASGLIGLTSGAVRGVNSLGQEFRDPSGSLYQKAEQTVAYLLRDIEPIAVQSTKEGDWKSRGMAAAGLTPAPKYVTDTATEAAIKTAYHKYVSPRETPFDKVQRSADMTKLRQLWEADDYAGYENLLQKVVEKHNLSDADIRRLETGLQRGDDPVIYMFSRLEWPEQKRMLDKMKPEDRERFLEHADRRIRYDYEAPE